MFREAVKFSKKDFFFISTSLVHAQLLLALPVFRLKVENAAKVAHCRGLQELLT